MRFKKKNKRGIILLFLLLLITTSISFITFNPKNNKFEESSISISAPEDPYEENDDPLSAYNLSFWEANWLSNHLGNGSQWDDDWYIIDLDFGEERLRVELNYSYSAGNIDIEVYNSTYDLIIGNYSLDDNEILELDLFPSGVYYLRIFGDNAQNTYDLWWEDLLPSDDRFEENDDYWSAAPVVPNYHSNLKIAYGDEDWFRLYLNAGETINISIYFNHMDGDLDLEIYDPSDFNNPRVGSYSIDDNEEIFLFTANISGDWRIRVYNATPVLEVYYNMDIWVFMIDDWMEDNDDFGSAWLVNPNYYSNLQIVYGDMDWFRIHLNTGDAINVTLYFTHMDGNLELELYDPSNSYRTGSYSTNNFEHISFTADFSGEWRILVYHVDANSDVYYDMDIWIYGGDDGWEDNDDFGSAHWMDPNSYHSGLKIVYSDEDWFRTYLNPGDTIEINIYFSHIDGDLDLELFDPYNTHRTGSYSVDNDEFISHTIDVSGDWRFRIYHVNADSDVYYDIDMWVYSSDDWMEENDDFWSACYIDPDYYSGLQLVHGDEDWFSTYLNVDDNINVSIYFNHYDGNLTLELYDPFNNYRVGSYSLDHDEFISYRANVSGDWCIRVYHADANSEVYYDMDIWVYRGDDWMEENDDYWSAWYLDPAYYPDLMIIEWDNDWFRTYLDIDDTIDISIYFDSYEGNLQLELYDPHDSVNPREGSYSSRGDEHISFTSDIAGEWRFRIYHEHGDSNVWYHLEIRVNGEMGGDDPYEMNNDFNEAYDIHDDERTWLSHLHGLAVQGDFDWYSIDVTPGFQHLMVNLKFNRSHGNINVDIYRLVGLHNIEWVTSNYSLSGKKWIDINITHIDWGIYFIQVHGDSSGVEYDLWWDDFRTDNRTDDNYEENDDPANAYDLSFHQYEELMWIDDLAIQSDNDWYKIPVGIGFEHLYVLVKYDYQEGAIGIEIYDWNIAKITNNFTMEDNEYISYTLPSNGTYYIRIFGDRSGNTYSFVWSTREPGLEEMIPGYDIFIILGGIFGVVVAVTFRWKKSRKH